MQGFKPECKMKIEVKIDATLDGTPGHIQVFSVDAQKAHVRVRIVDCEALVHVDDLIDAVIRCRRDRRSTV